MTKYDPYKNSFRLGGILSLTLLLFFIVGVNDVYAGATNRCNTDTWTTGGTIVTSEDAPSTNFYHGAWFQASCDGTDTGATNGSTVSSITITVNDATGLSNMDIYTDQDATCSTANPTTATLYGTNATVGATTAITGEVVVPDNETRCFYVILDIGSGVVDQQTLDISLNADTDISENAPNTVASPSFPLNPSGVTTINNAGSPPTVTTTDPATGITNYSATISGNITDTGGENANERGFAWGTSSDLTTGVSTSTTFGDYSTGPFSQDITALFEGTQYWFRAYAANTTGTSTGSIVSFTATTDTTPSRTMRLFEGFTLKFISGTVILHQGQ